MKAILPGLGAAARWTRYCIALFLLVVGSASRPSVAANLAFAQPEEAGYSASCLRFADAVLKQHLDANEYSGAVGLIARQGKVVYLRAFGLRDREANLPMETNSLFRIASMSKIITSAGMMRLIEQGAASLDDPVSRFIPEFANPQIVIQGDSQRRTRPSNREITLRHLLSHTSGITYRFVERFPLSTMYAEAGIDDGLCANPGTVGEMVTKLAHQPLWFTPGTAYEYGLSTDVIGRVIEVITGQTLDQYLQESIFEPLGMVDTGFHVPDAERHRLAAIYWLTPSGDLERLPDDPPVVQGNMQYSPSHAYATPGTYFSGGGGLISTAYDYARFLQTLLNGGELEGRRILSQASVQTLTANAIGSLTSSYARGLGSQGVTLTPSFLEWPGSYWWGGFWGTGFLVDPTEQVIIAVFVQQDPRNYRAHEEDFQQAANEAITECRLFAVRGPTRNQVSWRRPSLVPQPGRQLLAGCRILQTTDFKTWEPFGTDVPPARTVARTLTRALPEDQTLSFVRLETFRTFTGWDLRGQSLVNADLEGAGLQDSRLAGADLSHANLRGANLTGADLQEVILVEADLTGATGFDDTQTGIVFQDTILPDGSVRSQ